MRKTLILLLGIFIIYSCSTDNNSNTALVPEPPSNLVGTLFSTTQVNLSWIDNSSNETGFKIERKTGTGNYAIVGTINTDTFNFSDTGLAPSTTYIYRVFSYNTIGNSSTFSNEITITTGTAIALPVITTTEVSLISSSSTSSGGTIISDGGGIVIARGIVWSTSSNPTIDLATKTTDGTGTGIFTSTITGLSAATSFHVRAYATNSVGTSYGNDVVFTTTSTETYVTDIDGNVYPVGTICGQDWMIKNLNVSKYSDGTIIPQVTDITQWANLTTGAWCYYENNTVNGTTYGKLYNWYAIFGIYNSMSLTNPALRKQLAPMGYHIPSGAEWEMLTDCLGGIYDCGGKMKESGTTHWLSPNSGATNVSGFTGLPAGMLYSDSRAFTGRRENGLWWSSTEYSTTDGYGKTLNYYGDDAESAIILKSYGVSVRCIRD